MNIFKKGKRRYKLFPLLIFLCFLVSAFQNCTGGLSTQQQLSQNLNYITSSNDVISPPQSASSSTTTIPPQSSMTSTPTTSYTAKYYIRMGATGNGSGSDWTNACPDFTGVCNPSSMVRGAIYYVATGTYAGYYDFNEPDNSSTVITIKGATSADHGIDAGWKNNFSVSVADGGRQATFTNALKFTSNHWIIDGSVGSAQSSATASSNYGFGIHNDSTSSGGGLAATFAQGIKNVTISHFEIDGIQWDIKGAVGANAFYVTPSAQCADFTQGLTFDHVFVHDQKGTPFMMGGNINIQYSYIVRIRSTPGWHGEGVASRGDCGTGQIDHSVFRYNVFQDVHGTGNLVVLYNTGRNWQVYGNVFYSTGATCTDCNGVGPTVVDNTDSGFLIGLKFYNNTIYNSDGKCGAFSTNTSGSSSFDIRNNIFYGCKGGISLGSSSSGDTLDYNTYWNSYIYFCDGTGGCPGTHDSYICGTKSPCYVNLGTPPAASSVFVNPNSGDFRLQSNTISGFNLFGSNLNPPYNVDMNGKIRTRWSKGAFEY